MLRARVLFVMLALVLVLVGGSLGQEKATKAKGKLPLYWSKLSLSSEQKQKIYEIQSKYAAQREPLQQKLKEIGDQERMEREKVLTDAQKAQLRELLLQKAPADSTTEKKSEKKDK